jgi:hypothetical protein
VRIALVLALAAGLGVAARVGATNPSFVPSNFVSRIDNQWFPLTPGTVYVYTGVKDGKPSRDVVTVTHTRKTIAAVAATEVKDELYVEGRLEERTTDWYAQDRQGNVWYLGESTAELDKVGRVTSREGTWLTGRDGAQAGIYMPAHPAVGSSGRQEYLKGHAEDHFRVVSLDAAASSPYVSTAHALLTEEWTPLEPGVLDHKLYVRGIGTVREETVKGGVERNVLVSLRRP